MKELKTFSLEKRILRGERPDVLKYLKVAHVEEKADTIYMTQDVNSCQGLKLQEGLSRTSLGGAEIPITGSVQTLDNHLAGML